MGSEEKSKHCNNFDIIIRKRFYFQPV